MNVRSRATKPRSAGPTPAKHLRLVVARNWQGAAKHGLVIIRTADVPATTPDASTRRSASPSDLFQALARRIRPFTRKTDDLLVTDEGIALVLYEPGADGTYCVFQRIIELTTSIEEHTEHTIQTGTVVGRRTGRRTHVTETDDACRQVVGIGYASGIAAASSQQSPSSPKGHQASRTKHSTQEKTSQQEFDALFTQAWEIQARVTLSITALMNATPTHTSPTPLLIAKTNTLDDEEQVERDATVLRQHAEAVGAPFIHLPARLTPMCQRAIPYELASELRAIPIGRTRTTLTIAMERPQDTQALRRLRLETGLMIFPVLGAPDEIERALTLLVER